MDLTAIRSRLAGSEGRLYWRSLGELADTPEFREYLHREFPEQASEWNDPKGRRDFLKLMSASLALAGVGACTKQPTEAIIPYVRQPEDVVPGRPLFFASAIVHRGYAQPVLVESHMGRPTKIEGNPEHPASLGAADSFTQAALLDLYDPDRAKTVTYRGEVRSWSNFLTAAQGALTSQKSRQGAGLRFLTGPDHVSVAGRTDGDHPARLSAGEVAPVRSGRDAGGDRVERRHRIPSITSTRRTSSSHSTPTSLDTGRGTSAISGTSPIGGGSPTSARR